MRKIIQTVIEYHDLVRERVLCEHLYPRMVSPLAVQRNGVVDGNFSGEIMCDTFWKRIHKFVDVMSAQINI